MNIKIKAWGHIEGEDDYLMHEDIDLIKIHGQLMPHDSETGKAICDHSLIMFTGLMDWNGRGIWESDIVIDHVGKGVVEYSEKYAGFRVNYGNGQCKWFYDYNLRGERESIEVIGNVHMNPELLKGE